MSQIEGKRKRIVLTLEDKLAVIQERETGLSVDKVATMFNIGASTVSEICKKRAEIEQAVVKNRASGKVRKTLKEPTKPVVENELYAWYMEQKQLDQVPSQSEVLDKAKEINAQLDQDFSETLEDWNPTKGWLARFKERYGIKPESKRAETRTWQALEAADYLLDYINTRDYLLKDVITVRMIRDRIANEHDEEQVADQQ